MTRDTYLIVGGGMAGAKTAQALRELGCDGRIVLAGAEKEVPYERPPLTKGYLAGTTPRQDLAVVAGRWYADHDVELELGTAATSLDLSEAAVTLADGRRISYDRLLLATGSRPRRLDVPGGDLGGLFYLRDLGDCDRLRAELSGHPRPLVIIGGGWIGLEAAAVAATMGHHVTVVEPGPAPLHAALGTELGGFFARVHRDHGVAFRLGTRVARLVGSGGRLTAVETGDGELLPAEVAVAGIGALPRVQLAQQAGLATGNGVVTDAALRTSHPDVYAAGDIASAWQPFLSQHARIEHWATAHDHGAVAAAAMMGLPAEHDRLPFFFTDQYDLGAELAGHLRPGGYERVVYRGDPAAGEFVAFWIAAGRVVAGMNVNVWDVTEQIQALIRSRAVISPDALSDPDVPLAELAAGAASGPGRQAG
jgi:3-phenylpropionate/trans-cinnamate dioxygenase ferredoxin reductase component